MERVEDFEEDGKFYIVMEPLDHTLAAYMEENAGGSLTLDERLVVLRKLFKAVAHVHERARAFVDLKPANFMVATRFGAMLWKLVDVGSARAVGRPLSEPLPASWTPAYGSPEAAAAYASGTLQNFAASAASDVYSMGVVAAQLLDAAFVPLFASDEDALARLLDDPPRLPQERLLCGGSARAQDLVRRMLDPLPERRPTMAQIMTEESLVNPGMVSSGLALGAKIEGVGARVARVGRAADGAKHAAEAALDAALAGAAAGGGGGGGDGGMHSGKSVPTPTAWAHVPSGDFGVVDAVKEMTARLEARLEAISAQHTAISDHHTARLEASIASVVDRLADRLDAAIDRCALALRVWARQSAS